MSSKDIKVKDCSRICENESKNIKTGLEELSKKIKLQSLVVSLSETGRQVNDEPVVYKEGEQWWTGRYIGVLAFGQKFGNRKLIIQPRLGCSEESGDWLSSLSKMVLTHQSGKQSPEHLFIPLLLAKLWEERLLKAARHGLPLLRQEVQEQGRFIRGRLDVQATVPLLANRRQQVVSVYAIRSLQHAVAEVMAAAYVALRRQLPKWSIKPRTQEIINQLLAVTGSRPTIPSLKTLQQVRYTPLTAQFAGFAEFSRQIALHQGINIRPDINSPVSGILLDVAEIWELYVLEVLRRAVATQDITVSHGTQHIEGQSYLLYGTHSDKQLGYLKPDFLLRTDGNVVAVADAKYKRMYTKENIQREDLYQMTAYLSQFRSSNRQAMTGWLIYPELKPENISEEQGISDQDVADLSELEREKGWQVGQFSQIKLYFLTLPHDIDKAVTKCRQALTEAGIIKAQ